MTVPTASDMDRCFAMKLSVYEQLTEAHCTLQWNSVMYSKYVRNIFSFHPCRTATYTHGQSVSTQQWSLFESTIYIHTKPSIHNTILKYDTHLLYIIVIVVTYHHNVQTVFLLYQHFMSNTKNTWVQNICVAFEWLLVLHSESGKKVQLFVRGVALMPSVGCSYHAKMSVVTHWKKRKVHWTKIYHIMLVPSAPRKYQNICNG